MGVELMPMGVELIDSPLWRPPAISPSAMKPEKKLKKAKRKSIRPPTPRPDRCELFLPFIY